tara:strand:- start:2169 stop:2504 length:336 start_codon:yes stop_codon:yes gene_type:complete
MSVIDRLRKRRFYPVTIDGEVIHIRALLDSELKTVSAFQNEDESIGFAIGCSLINEDKSDVFTIAADESAKQFGARVLAEINLPSDTKAELTSKILKLSNGPPSAEDLKKN